MWFWKGQHGRCQMNFWHFLQVGEIDECVPRSLTRSKSCSASSRLRPTHIKPHLPSNLTGEAVGIGHLGMDDGYVNRWRLNGTGIRWYLHIVCHHLKHMRHQNKHNVYLQRSEAESERSHVLVISETYSGAKWRAICAQTGFKLLDANITYDILRISFIFLS